MLFMEVYIMGVDNGVVCVLSWVMFMIGRYLSCFLLAGFNILDDYVFFGEILQDNGYDVFGIGKWYNSCYIFNWNFNIGEYIFMGGMYDFWNMLLYYY